MIYFVVEKWLGFSFFFAIILFYNATTLFSFFLLFTLEMEHVLLLKLVGKLKYIKNETRCDYYTLDVFKSSSIILEIYIFIKKLPATGELFNSRCL